jgi:ubiquinone/menaquinone biosynthesis C-methylase UbiE
LLIDTFHHIEHRDEMLHDMKSILKPGGKLIVNEPIARKSGDIYKGCHTRVYTPEEIISSFAANGLRLEKTYKTVKSSRNRVRVFVFVHS